jgi:hypothetical protein
MSRSYKKNPIIGNTGTSEKYDKVHTHRKTRKQIRDHITATHGDLELLEEMLMPNEEEVSDTWTMAKDGKRYIDPIIRDDDTEFMKEVKTKIMRK